MTLNLAKELIRRRSLTPDDAGCQQLIARRLEQAGFRERHLRFGSVDNLWITHGNGAPVFAFLGHTDVVPTGPVQAWQSDPFEPVLRDGLLYGRGAADMKGSVAAMVVAMEKFAAAHPEHRGTLALLLTSDEEGDAVDGTRRVVEQLTAEGVKIDWCLVGEPSSHEILGDTVKNGRRGSLTGTLIVEGVQGHVAYPQLADNPVHRSAPALAELCAITWDQGNEHYPPTGFQISNIHAGTGADNVIPGMLEVLFNFRFSTALTPEQIQKRMDTVLTRHNLRYRIRWGPANMPFLTRAGALLEAVQETVAAECGRRPQLSTAGGTSDGRFIAPTGAEVVELGPVNRTIHKVDECVSVADLETLTRMYEKIAGRLLTRTVES
ncbi:MAG: succinyl-diaminopimelate desuccinylase [Gammaproteobacteria bacterium]|nr:succinyl-diaminopimelate desuccinylase [Gammaproteobacteria bacterium]